MDWRTKIVRMDQVLSRFFYKFGGCVARRPAVFFVVPLVLTLILTVVLMLRIEFVSTLDYLYVPTEAKGLTERDTIEHLFPANLSRYVLGTETRLPCGVDVILTSTDTSNPSILTRSLWEEAAQLVKVIEEIKVVTNLLEFGWKDICASFMGKCLDNSHLSLLNRLSNLTFPITKEGDKTYHLVAYMGGIELGNGALLIKEAHALRLIFPVEKSRLGYQATKMWGSAVTQLVSKVRMENVQIECFSLDKIENDAELNIYSAMEVLPITIFLLATFTIYNSMFDDMVKSKPMVGVMGLLNTVLACLSGFGVSVILGYKWQAINLTSLFLLLGIGLDGVFLMLSSWSRSGSKGCDFITRMSITYADVSVSITISSLTNMISFFVGAMVPGCPCVHIFCAFTGMCILFNYIWTLTMFGAVLAWFGQLEENNRHCIFMYTVESKEKEVGGLKSILSKNIMKVVDLAWVLIEMSNKNLSNNVTFFGNVLSPLLYKFWSQTLIFVVFGCYLIMSCWGIAVLHKGLEIHRLVRDDSPSKTWFHMQQEFFMENPYRIQIVVPEPMDYHNVTIQNQLLTLIDKFESSQFISNFSQYRQSWLHEFLYVASENFIFFNISTEEQFLSGIHRFLDIKEVIESPIKDDVQFDEDGSTIVSSRFFLQSGRIDNAEDQVEMQRHMREIASSAPFPVFTYHALYPFMDQFSSVLSNTTQCIAILLVIMAFITILLIPNRMSVIWVIFTVLSTQIGIVGFMSLWNINLDVISMIVIIMSIGFSVDFSAHISYHYLSADPTLCPLAKLTHTLESLGPPIMRGALTTLIGTMPVLFQPSYILSTFSKMMFLCITFGLVHSLLLLPCLLLMFGPIQEADEDNLEESKKVSDTPVLGGQNLHLSFFRPNESEYSGSSSSGPVKEYEEYNNARRSPIQMRHLRRAVKEGKYWTRNSKGPRYLPSRTNIPVHIRNVQDSRTPHPQSPLAADINQITNAGDKFIENENYVVCGQDNPCFQKDETINTPSVPRRMDSFRPKKLQVEENIENQENMKSVMIGCIDDQHQDSAVFSPSLESFSRGQMSDDEFDRSFPSDSFEEIELEK